MDLTELNNYADELLEQLKATSSAAEVRDIVFRLDGLHSAAHIKAAAAVAGTGIDPELHKAFHGPVKAHEFWPIGKGSQECMRCRFFESASVHHGVDYSEPTKPVADRLHELVSYFASQRAEADHDSVMRGAPGDIAAGRHTAYADAAEKLEALLMEGGI